nr:uncharacterized protein LOC119160779 [Rhipicephalus microplus]XP_037268911.1 uncharacterized protein LOC119160779 [Rhipicephalus microplus]
MFRNSCQTITAKTASSSLFALRTWEAPALCILRGCSNQAISSAWCFHFVLFPLVCNIKLFENLISGIDWSTVTEERDPNKSYNIFSKHLTSLYDACFPLKPYKKHRKCRKPWVTVELYNRIKVKNNLFQVFLSSGDENDLRELKKIRNTLNKDLKKAMTKYYITKFTTHSGDARRLWDTINQLINKKEISRRIKFEKLGMSRLEIADTFNKYFLTVGESTTDSTETCCENYIASNYPSSVFLFPTDQQEVVKLITSLKDNCACGPDDIKPKPLKAISHIIATPLTHIYNFMLSSGVFPDQMKVAKVTVIHKGGSFDELNNYRPISVLSVFAEMAERVIYKRIMCFLNANIIIAKDQYGFCENKSAESALLSIKEYILDNIGHTIFTLGIFLDFR